ncbi:MAG: rRNA methyltransferase [Rhodospirillaceae bacterium]|nr:MAG: rRNA methyltransferase [Rhodospirillaceae bacterium]
MAGTDSTKILVTGGPVVVLVGAQLGENIGTAVRAMGNCGLGELRLVNPRAGWLNEKTIAASSGADAILDAARVYASTAEATADLHHVFATTTRTRDMEKPVVTPRVAANVMRSVANKGEKVGLLFGPERSGLTNEDVALAKTIIAVPLNPAFSSLNLAQAVLLLGYEWFQAGLAPDDVASSSVSASRTGTLPATQAALLDFFAHLEGELDICGFLRIAEKRSGMVLNIRNIFTRAGLTDREVSTLRGIVSCLAQRPRG